MTTTPTDPLTRATPCLTFGDLIAMGETEEERTLLAYACRALRQFGSVAGHVVFVQQRGSVGQVAIADRAEVDRMIAINDWPDDMCADLRRIVPAGGIALFMGDTAQVYSLHSIRYAGQA